MHHAPSVLYPVGRSRFLGALVGLLAALGLATVAAYGVSVGAWAPTLAMALLAVLAGGLALRWWRHLPGGLLQFEGGLWHWSPDLTGHTEPLSALSLHLDGQAVLLLQGRRPGRPPLWLWAERATDPLRWDDLRRAVYSRASVPASAPRP